jgi:hypothetical protein
MLTIKDETFHGQYPFAPHYYSHQGIDIHYVDEGLTNSVLEAYRAPFPTPESRLASHFLQEDAPERIIPLIETFLRANPK